MNAPVRRVLREKHVPVVWRSLPFVGDPKLRVLEVERRMPTVTEIVASIPKEELPLGWDELGEVRINGEVVPKIMWPFVRPKYDDRPFGTGTVVELLVPLRGPGGSGGGGGAKKNPLAMIATIAVLLVAAAVSGGALGLGAIGFLSAGAVNAIAGATIGLAGTLIIAALSPPPTLTSPQSAAPGSTAPLSSAQKSAASLTGNVLSPSSAVPRVVGTMRLFPPLATPALVEVVGDDEYAETVMVLAGPHALSDGRVEDASADAMAQVQTQYVEGKPGDAIQTLVTRQSFTASINATLLGHVFDATTQFKLADQNNPASDVPQPQPLATRKAPDEVWINLVWPQGLSNSNASGAAINVAVRLQIRRRGQTAWINMPEVHFSMNNFDPFQKVIRLKWDTPRPTPPNTPPTNQGPVYAFTSVPGQSAVSPTTSGWTADSSFYAGSGDTYFTNSNFNTTTGVRNVELYSDKAIFYLDPTVFTPDYYEMQIVRSHAYTASSFTVSNYHHSTLGAVADFFFYYLSGTVARIVEDMTSFKEDMQITRLSSIWNENPIQSNDFATISIRVRGVQLQQFSVLASGYTYDWDGSGWNTLTTTSNPAPHLRDVLGGNLCAIPISASLINDTELVDFRSHCIDMDYTVNAVVEGKTADAVLTMIAGAGYARVRHNEKWGVIMDKDRSGDSPLQVFTPRNMNNFSWTRAFTLNPSGIRASYVDADDNYNTNAEIVVFADDVNQDANTLSQVTYDGLVHQDDVIARAAFDLAQSKKRFTFYQGDVQAEVLVTQRGDLVAVQHDVLANRAGYARIAQVIRNSSGQVAGLRMDGSVPAQTTPGIFSVDHLFTTDHIFDLGKRTGVAIRLKSGSGILTKEVLGSAIPSAEGHMTSLIFATPFTDPGTAELDADCLAAFGPLTQEYKRLIVYGVQPKEDLTATITFVDEAPELFF